MEKDQEETALTSTEKKKLIGDLEDHCKTKAIGAHSSNKATTLDYRQLLGRYKNGVSTAVTPVMDEADIPKIQTTNLYD
jgi:hypothetical protein